MSLKRSAPLEHHQNYLPCCQYLYGTKTRRSVSISAWSGKGRTGHWSASCHSLHATLIMAKVNSGNTAEKARPNKLCEDSDEEKLNLKIDSLQTKKTTPPFIYILTFFAALGGFLFGYDTGVISGAMILLRNAFNLSSVWQELIVSVTIGAAAIFALVGGFLNDRLGRRPVIMIASLIFTLGSICMGIAKDKFALLSGRIVVGAGIGR